MHCASVLKSEPLRFCIESVAEAASERAVDKQSVVAQSFSAPALIKRTICINALCIRVEVRGAALLH